MVAGCGANCIKYILFFFNIIFFLLGLCLIGIGAYGLIARDVFVQNFNSEEARVVQAVLMLISIVFLAAGCILVGICFFGCCGAIKEVKCMLGTYAVLLAIVIIAELVVVVRVFMYKGHLQSALDLTKDTFKSSVYTYTGEDDYSFDSVDTFQQDNKCCGADSWEDFMDHAKNWVDKKQYKVPLSCCKLTTSKTSNIVMSDLLDRKCPKSPTRENSYISMNCKDKMNSPEFLELVFNIIVGVGFGLLALELLGIILSVILIRNIGEVRAVPV